MSDLVWVRYFFPKALVPVPRKMVQFNPGLSQILSKVFLSKNMPSELTNQLCLSTRFTVMITQNVFLSNA